MAKVITIPLNDLHGLVNNDVEIIAKYKEHFKGLKRQCPLCGKSFIPSGRLDTKYCKACIEQGGSQKAYKQKIEEDGALKDYNREYQRRYAKIRRLKGEDRKKALEDLRQFTKEFRDSTHKNNTPMTDTEIKAALKRDGIEKPVLHKNNTVSKPEFRSFPKGGK